MHGTGRLLPDIFLFFKKDLYDVKASVRQLSFNIIRQPSICHRIKTNLKLLIQRYA